MIHAAFSPDAVIAVAAASSVVTMAAGYAVYAIIRIRTAERDRDHWMDIAATPAPNLIRHPAFVARAEAARTGAAQRTADGRFLSARILPNDIENCR